MSRTANPTPTFVHGLPAYLGGKRRFCPLLFTLLAEHLSRADWQTSRFLDPFSGGGAVSLYAKAQSFGWTIANNYSFYSTSAVGTDTSSGDSLRITITGSAVGGTPPSPTLSVADAEGNEGDDMAFTVTLSEAAAADVTAAWTASIENGDTAQAEDLGSTTGDGEPDDGDVHGADDGRHHRRARRNLHADPVEPVERDAGGGPDCDGHHH